MVVSGKWLAEAYMNSHTPHAATSITGRFIGFVQRRCKCSERHQ